MYMEEKYKYVLQVNLNVLTVWLQQPQKSEQLYDK